MAAFEQLGHLVDGDVLQAFGRFLASSTLSQMWPDSRLQNPHFAFMRRMLHFGMVMFIVRSQSSIRSGLARRSWSRYQPCAAFDRGAAQPLGQGHLMDAEVLGNLGERHALRAGAGDPHDVLTELSGIWGRHRTHPSRPPDG